jgi:hypothetical protein
MFIKVNGTDGDKVYCCSETNNDVKILEVIGLPAGHKLKPYLSVSDLNYFPAINADDEEIEISSDGIYPLIAGRFWLKLDYDGASQPDDLIVRIK